MGVGNSNPQFQASNYVLDYSVNLLYPDRYGQIMQRLGPNINNFPAEGRNKVLSDFNEALQSASPELMAQYGRYRSYACLMFVLILVGFFSFLFVPATLAANTDGSFAFLWVVFIALFCAGFVGICVIGAKSKAIARELRTQIITNLQSKMSIWAAMYPQFTFTIIWPVEVWRRSNKKRRLVAIWCYVRVTQGPCQTGYNEPIYATTTAQQQQTVQPMVQQQVIQQQPQTVMVQGPNGQMIQGTPAVVNGQHVIMVQQPQGVPQQPVYQQQVVVQQPPPGYGQVPQETAGPGYQYS